MNYWTDYLKAPLHPRSPVLLSRVWHGVTPFSGFGDGRALRESGREAVEETVDRVRRVQGLGNSPHPLALSLSLPSVNRLQNSHRQLRQALPAPARYLAEECDSIAAVQCLLDDMSGAQPRSRSPCQQFGRLCATIITLHFVSSLSPPLCFFAHRPLP